MKKLSSDQKNKVRRQQRLIKKLEERFDEALLEGNLMTCPKCDTIHSKNYICPNCRYDSSIGM